MPTCSVCAHLDRIAIDRELVANRTVGTPSLRDIAGRHGISKTSLARHKDTHLEPHVAKLLGPPPTPPDRTAARLATLGAEQTVRGVRAIAEAELERGTELARLAERVARLVADRALDNPEALGGDALYETLAAIKGAVEARGGGMLKWAETLGRLTGEMPTGGGAQVNILVNPYVMRLLDAVARALTPFPEAAAAVRDAVRGLQSS